MARPPRSRRACRVDRGFAPAKINLALHVTGRRADGYHDLDSLVVFAGAGDQLTVLPATTLSLSVTGPFAEGVPAGEDNLVLRAARALARARQVEKGATIRLAKMLPHAAGIGSASADAAAAIRLLASFWGVEPLAPDDPEVLALGSDVPACLMAPRPLRMRGRGEAIEPLPPLPACGLVLVNPGVPVPTAAVFAALGPAAGDPLPPLPEAPDAEGLAAWIGQTRNDLQPPAETLAPPVTEALALLRRQPGVLAATMSGSGGTCVGITRDIGTARRAARALQIARQGWWVAPAPLLAA